MLRRAMPSERSGWPRRALQVVAAYGIAATVALIAVAVLGDRTAVTYSVALFSFWWLAPAPLLLVLAAALRSWRGVAAVVVPAVVCAVLQGPVVLNRLPGGDDGPVDLRVASYNVTHGRPLDGLTELIAALHPDVLLLQEVTVERRPELSDLPGYPHVSFSPLAEGATSDGDAVLSRFPIVDVQPVGSLPEGARPTDLVTVRADGREVALLSVHLASPCIGCVAGTQDANPAGGTGAAARVRLAESARYAEVVSALVAEGEAVVLGGDLNSSPLNRPLHALTGAGLTDAQRAVGTWPGLTRGPGPGVARVDVVLVAGLRPVRVAEGGRGASTHSPVVADLAWP